MSYLNYDGLAYFKSKLTNWVDQNYLSKTNTGNTTVAGNVTFTNPITGDLDGKAKKDWLGQKIDETYIKSIATNDNAGTIVYTKGNGSTNHILIDLLQGATPAANGKAGLVPAPTVSEMNYFLRGDGNWAVPTDVYVNQNLIASSNNNQFPVLLSGTSGTPATKTNATVGYTNVVSVNPLTNALMASQFISKHPTYNRQSAVTSKIQYSLNFTDIVSGAGHNLGEVVGYVDTVANGGEHELGLRLFGNPNVQGTEENYVYMGVGLSKTNVAYGHAPSTPLPADHNEPTDIITRDWLARNGSETGLVHTSMNETIDGTKTFTDETRNTSTAGITTTKLTASGKITGTGTAEISGGSGNTPSLKVTGNETVTGDLSVGGNEAVSGNETVGGTLTVTGKITGNSGVDTTTLHATDDVIADDDLTVGDTITVGGQILKKTGTNTTQEYVSYITNQESSRTTIINNMADTYTIKNNNSKLSVDLTNARATDLAKITTALIQIGGGLVVDSTTKKLKVTFEDPDPNFIKGVVEGMIDRDSQGRFVGGLATNPETGKLIVDFSQIDDATKDDILSGLSMQVPLRRNLTLYVNIATGSNTLDEGRGLTADKPFKNINNCVTWAVGYYALGKYNITILVAPGTYNESVNLTEYNTGSGRFYLQAQDPANPPVIYRDTPGGVCISCSGKWVLTRLSLENYPVDGPEGRNYYPYCLHVEGSGACSIRACNFVMKYNGETTPRIRMFMVNSNGGTVAFNPYNDYKTTFDYHLGDGVYLYPLSVSGNGRINFTGVFDDGPITQIDCKGDCTSFIDATGLSIVGRTGGGERYIYFAVAENAACTGKRYQVSSGAGITAPTGGFPGSTAGTVNSSTFSWYTGDTGEPANTENNG